MWEIFFFKNRPENKAETLVPDLFFFFFLKKKRTLSKVNASGQHISFTIFWYTSSWTYHKADCKMFQTIGPETCLTLIFYKKVWASFNIIFCVCFSNKILLTLYSINRPNFIVWLPLLLEILNNMCIVIICFPSVTSKILKLT